MPETIMKFGQEILIAIGTIIGAFALFWSRFASVFPSRKPKDDNASARKSDVEALRELIDHMARQQEEFHADNRKADERLHERLDQIEGRSHELAKQQARIEGACSALREIERRKP